MVGNDSLHASLLTCLPLVLVFCVRWRRKRWVRRWRRRMTTPGVTVGVGYHDEAGTLCTLNNAVRSACWSSSMFTFSHHCLLLFVISVVVVVVVERLVTVLVGWWPETDWSTPVSSIIITHTTSPHNTVNNHPPPTIHTIMISSEINSTCLVLDLYIIKYCQLVASIVICREC